MTLSFYHFIPASSKSYQISAATPRTDPEVSGLSFHPRSWFVSFAQISLLKVVQGNEPFIYTEFFIKIMSYSYREISYSDKEISFSYKEMNYSYLYIYIYIIRTWVVHRYKEFVFHTRKCVFHIWSYSYKDMTYSYVCVYIYIYKEMRCSYNEMSFSCIQGHELFIQGINES